MTACFDPPPSPTVPIAGSDQRFPVHRIYCVGRNYAEHAREMGSVAAKEGLPIFFMKPADAVVTDGRDPRFAAASEPEPAHPVLLDIEHGGAVEPAKNPNANPSP